MPDARAGHLDRSYPPAISGPAVACDHQRPTQTWSKVAPRQHGDPCSPFLLPSLLVSFYLLPTTNSQPPVDAESVDHDRAHRMERHRAARPLVDAHRQLDQPVEPEAAGQHEELEV